MRSAFLILLTLILVIPGQALAGDKIRGKYKVIGDLEKLKGSKQIEIKEFFNYSCGHCYRFLETSKRLHDKYSDKLLHKKYPIYWGDQTALPAMAFYISDEYGVEEKFTQELFDTNFKMQIDIFQPRVIRFLAKDFGLEKEFRSGMEDKRINAKVQESLAQAQKWNADETPTIIVNDILKVTPSISGGDVDKMTDNLDLIFQDILSYN
jgi:thiol:disulfide interchange protein DsbA